MALFTAFGAGKVVLLGEHAVVYGRPAIAGPLTLGVTARAVPSARCQLEVPAGLSTTGRELLGRAFEQAAKACGRPKVRVRLEAHLPVSMGLGSSAALAVACARVLLAASGRAPETPSVVALAREMEEVFHRTPSGVDHTCSAMGTLIYYSKRPAARAGIAERLVCPKPLKLLVALAGKRRPTGETVAQFRERLKRWPGRYGRLLQEVGRLAREGKQAILRGDLEALGNAMTVNHGLLVALGLSSVSIDSLVHRLLGRGALGAKLTGAGGEGGAVIGLFLEPEPVVARLSREGVVCFASQLAGPLAL